MTPATSSLNGATKGTAKDGASTNGLQVSRGDNQLSATTTQWNDHTSWPIRARRHGCVALRLRRVFGTTCLRSTTACLRYPVSGLR